ncbi:hypothetical protein SHKM778_64090 [Streptomyces sp. KM77-8]|uniref:Aminotransferase class I/classII large domain-containing protein n=1 Tax=Streptomyces haneummycinicus TaxID=3074435 RepID=A0AAT9HRU3_9ACTN
MLAIARAAGLRPVPVPVDADGVRPALLADAFRATGARVFVCQPLFQNPTGAVLAPERRGEVLRIAREAGAFVVEDDFVRRLVHEDAGPLPRPLAADDPDGVVVHVCSLTKATSPSFRVSALAAHGPVLERLRAIQIVDTFFVPRPLQEATLELVGSAAWPRHLRAISAALRIRRDAMTAALRLQLPELALPHIPSGGYHLWPRLPDGTAESALTAAALRAGVAVTPAAPTSAPNPGRPPPPELRGGGGHRGDHGRRTTSARGLGRGPWVGARRRAGRAAGVSVAAPGPGGRADVRRRAGPGGRADVRRRAGPGGRVAGRTFDAVPGRVAGWPGGRSTPCRAG